MGVQPRSVYPRQRTETAGFGYLMVYHRAVAHPIFRKGWMEVVKKQVLTFLTAAALLCGMLPASLPTAADGAAADPAETTAAKSADTAENYAVYAAAQANQPAATQTVTVPAEDGQIVSGEASVRQEAGCEGGAALATEEGSVVRLTVTVPADGRYTLSLRVSTEAVKRSSARRALSVDGATPFPELSELTFTRYWCDVLENGEFQKDNSGNQLRPDTEGKIVWQDQRLDAASGSPYELFLTAGIHTFELTATRERLVIDTLTLAPAPTVPSYAEVKQGWDAAGYTFAGDGANLTLEAEKPSAKSDNSLYPRSDRTSAATQPQSAQGLTLNTIGGSNWKTVGQWISWTVKVEKAGLYHIGIRYKQSSLRGVFVSRELTVDGALPFAEAARLRFPYGSRWQSTVLSDAQGNPYAFYLSEGSHTLTLRVVLGDLYELTEKVSTVLTALNADYRGILSVTGSSPDVNRDYNFPDVIPDVLADLAVQQQALTEAAETLYGITGQSGQMLSTLVTLYEQLERMTARPYRIAREFKTFKSNISSLGDWVKNMTDQPLLLDTLSLQSAASEPPRAEASFWESLSFNAALFVHSFTLDYRRTDSADADPLEVWVPTGRDQYQIVRTLAENDFTAKNNTPVNVRLVAPTALLPSTLAGRGPDVALSNAQHVPVDYALRGAVLPLDGFADAGEIYGRFSAGALTPLGYEGKTYGLPENQTWPMMFVRRDVFDELGVAVPDTWDELLTLLPTLGRRNLEFGMLVGYAGYLQILYQNGGTLYTEDGFHTALGTNEAVGAFTKLCDLFTQYKLPITYDAANRFRSGEMPLLVADYAFYNQLTVFAPEISGQWEMTSVPGTVKADGTVDRTVVATSTACIIMAQTDKPDEAWEFLKWWTSTETQVSFGTDMEAVLGPSAKQPTANIEAASLLPWSTAEYTALERQQKTAVGIPTVPGYYQAERLIGFAFNDVYNNNTNPRNELLDCLHSIDTELLRKYDEFHSSGQ